MRIVDPTHGLAPTDDAAAVPIAAATGRDGLCALSNSKPGATELLQEVGRRLGRRHHLDAAGFASKPSAAVGADPELLDHLAAQYRLAVVAIGD